jgi:Domain of unknown function (DUF4265)
MTKKRSEHDALATKDTAIHLNPAWRERATGMVYAKLKSPFDGRWEQLWARQLSDREFEICCIPFFVHNLALGDIVEISPTPERRVVTRVIQDSERFVFRIWFGDVANLRLRHEIMDSVAVRMVGFGCEQEWSSHDMLAVAVDPERAQDVADYLWKEENEGRLVYETGRGR